MANSTEPSEGSMNPSQAVTNIISLLLPERLSLTSEKTLPGSVPGRPARSSARIFVIDMNSAAGTSLPETSAMAIATLPSGSGKKS